MPASVRFPVYRPRLAGNEREYVNRCLDTTWISSRGEYIEKFEQAFGAYVGSDYATTVANGTVAIHLALLAAGVGPGDEVIVPTLTYVASVNTVVQAGATPVFAESLSETWQIDPADVERRITSKTKAVMAVHLYGQSCDMDALTRLCRGRNLLLIEDCAEAFGTRYQGQHVGTFGDVATFSFFGNKTITTGEGGMVVCRDPDVYRRATHLKSQGVSRERVYWHDVIGYNYRMTNIAAAIGLAQIEQADFVIARKREVAAWYAAGLAELPVNVHAEAPGTLHSFWMCSLLTDTADTRDALRDHLAERGVETRPLFWPSHMLPMYGSGAASQYPIASSLGLRGMNLPSYPDLSHADVASICDEVADFFHQRRAF